MKIKDGKLLYHLTTIDVFESIVVNGLLSRKELNAQKIKFTDTANHDILIERERLNLSGYIPFHFHIHTKYDTAVKNTHTDKTFIYLCIHRNYARAMNFLILPIHPASTEQPNLYSYDEGINKINWDIMELKKSDELPNGVTEELRNLVRMAECLSPNKIDISDFLSISVKDDDSFYKVKEILKKHRIQKSPYINIDPKYF